MTALLTSVPLFLADSDWGWHDGDIGDGWMVVMMLGMVVFWGAVIALIAYLVVHLSRSHRYPDRDALEVLSRRFASGEISQEEYEQRRSVLLKS